MLYIATLHLPLGVGKNMYGLQFSKVEQQLQRMQEEAQSLYAD